MTFFRRMNGIFNGRSKFYRQPETWIAIGIIVLTVAAYIQVATFEFVTFDDPLYIVRNHVIQSGLNWNSFKYAFTSGDDGSYLPFVWLSHAASVSLFKAWAGGHHLVNVLFHVLNSVFLFFFLKRATRNLWPSAAVAFLFALHPLHVESVAWVAERKDVLSTLFWILTSWAYVRYTENRTAKNYTAMIFLFAIGLLSKSMLVTLPVTLLLLDIWPLKRVCDPETGQILYKKLMPFFVEKIPLFVLSFLAAFATFYSQKHIGAVAPTKGLLLQVRLENAALSSIIYLKQTFLPTNLSAFYPYSWVTLRTIVWVGALSLLVILSIVSLISIKRRPYLLVGWVWYLVTLLPVIGIIQVGSQSHADRYTYVPLIGIFIAISWAGYDLAARFHFSRKLLLAGGAAVMGGLFTLTFAQVYVWKDNLTLFKNALSYDTSNPVALLNIGDECIRRGSYQNAFAAYYQALQFSSGLYLSHAKAGSALELLGNPSGALVYYQNANMLKPGLISVDQKIGHALTLLGRFDEAETHVQRVISHPEQINNLADPVDPQVSWTDWATILLHRNRNPEARDALEQGLTKDPNRPHKASISLCYALLQLKRFDDALHVIKPLQEAHPQDSDLMYILGLVYIRLTRYSDAEQIYTKLKNVDPHSSLLPIGLAQLEIGRSSK